jgi:hypothetical protein
MLHTVPHADLNQKMRKSWTKDLKRRQKKYKRTRITRKTLEMD